MTARPADIHLGLITPQCYAVAERALRILHELEAEYVLVGGWAVFAYGSRIPSVDTDIYLDVGTRARVIPEIQRRTDIRVGPGLQLEPLDYDSPNNIMGRDPDFGEDELGYVPRNVLAGRVNRMELGFQKRAVPAIVPTAEALLFTKLKSYHDRELAWRAMREPEVMATLPMNERHHVKGMGESYFFRKASKDLHDIAHLATRQNASEAAFAIADEVGLGEQLRRPLETVPRPLVDVAADLARERPALRRWLRQRAQR